MRRATTFVCLSLLIGTQIAGVASASETDYPEEVRNVWWAVSGVEGPHTFLARSASVGTCGEAPWLQPQIRERDGIAWITMLLHIPPVHLEPNQKCQKKRWRARVKVTIKQELHDVSLFDASKAPPQHRALPWERLLGS